MKHLKSILFSALTCLAIALFLPRLALAQENPTPDAPLTATPAPQPALLISTTYPSQTVALGEVVTVSISLKAVAEPQTVAVGLKEIPDGWSGTFRGAGRIVQSVFVDANSNQTVDLRLEPSAGVAAGTYNFLVLAEGGKLQAELPITLVVQEKAPASLTFQTDLPTIKGSPTTTFRYSTTLKNEGDDELSINLSADAPQGFQVNFKLGGQDVTSFPLGANQSKSISVELLPVSDILAGKVPFKVFADGGEVQAEIDLMADVTGQYNLSVTGPDGRLSGKANAGKETTLQIVVSNSGTASAQGVELTGTAPSGWNVTFDPKVVDEIPAGGQAEVTARITPADKAVAGDYMITIHAKPVDGSNKSADFRITVSTSTLWGVAGLALIAVAVAVVALAVMRFGRR